MVDTPTRTNLAVSTVVSGAADNCTFGGRQRPTDRRCDLPSVANCPGNDRSTSRLHRRKRP